VWLPAWLPGRAAARALPAVFKSVRNFLSGSMATWAFSGRTYHVTEDHPAYIPRDLPLLSAQSKLVRWQADPDSRATRDEAQKRCGRATYYERVTCVAHGFKVRANLASNFPRCRW